jgi:hypothetical protein
VPARIREALKAALSRNGDHAALAFAEAVAVQRARPLGGAPLPEAEQQRLDTAVAERVTRLVHAANGHAAHTPGTVPAPPAPTAELRSDPVLLAAVFQNIDLLYRDGYPHADTVSDFVMRALSRACERAAG